MFSQACVKNSVHRGRCTLPLAHPLDRHTPHLDTHTPGQTSPPWAENPCPGQTTPWADTPRVDTPRQTSTAADGTHSSGKHSGLKRESKQLVLYVGPMPVF